jgi:hypothetical protein
VVNKEMERFGLVIDVGSGRVLKSIPGMLDPVFSLDGSILVTDEWVGNGTRQGRLAVYDKDMNEAYSTPWSGSRAPSVPQPSFDGRYVYFKRQGDQSGLFALDLATGEELRHDIGNGYIDFSADGSAFLLRSRGEQARMTFFRLDGKLLKNVWSCDAQNLRIEQIAVSRSGRFVALKYVPHKGSRALDLLVINEHGATVGEAGGRDLPLAGIHFIGDSWLFEGTAFPGSWHGALADWLLTTRAIELYDLREL